MNLKNIKCRGVQVRKSFMTELASTHRAFRIKNCDFELPGIPVSDTKSNVSCIICIVNNENNGLDDSERQMYRFDTHGVSKNQNRSTSHLDNFLDSNRFYHLIPCSDSTT